jgi:hypothetical protein
MRSFFLLCGLSATVLMGQSMLEVGGIVSGSSVGSAAGKKLSDSLNTTLKKTAKAAEKAAKAEPEKKAETKKQQADVPEPAAVDPAFLPSRPKSGSGDEANNVPPPPPPKKKAQPQQPTRAARVPAPAVAPVRYEAPRPEPLNVDLATITAGMRRDQVLKLGQPSSRISMYEGGHLLEIYNYRNATYPSGSLRLQDGTVTAVETR